MPVAQDVQVVDLQSSKWEPGFMSLVVVGTKDLSVPVQVFVSIPGEPWTTPLVNPVKDQPLVKPVGTSGRLFRQSQWEDSEVMEERCDLDVAGTVSDSAPGAVPGTGPVQRPSALWVTIYACASRLVV